MGKAAPWTLAAFAAVIVLAVAGLTVAGQIPKQQPDRATFCFAEWCVTPTALKSTGSTTLVDLEVRSTAVSRTQRPDHPQAWIVDAQGRMTGGAQPSLEDAIGPQQSYGAELRFAVITPGCATFVVAEGAWPSFLGLGYAPSPFAERASWHLCD